jgi:D-sedoheptulose 7-phosphate isomerase
MKQYDGVADQYLSKLIQLLTVQDRAEIDTAVGLIAKAWQEGRQIIALGNGGSALTALHLITDWSKGISMSTGRPFKGRTLLENMGLITAYGNDTAYTEIFIEQLKVVLNPSDLVLAISGSGNSKNVLKAVSYANENGAQTLGLCGYGGGQLKGLCHHVVWANVNDMQLAEDLHAIFGHIVMQSLCNMLN